MYSPVSTHSVSAKPIVIHNVVPSNPSWKEKIFSYFKALSSYTHRGVVLNVTGHVSRVALITKHVFYCMFTSQLFEG
jgi:hypothetical protein